VLGVEHLSSPKPEPTLPTSGFGKVGMTLLVMPPNLRPM